MTDLEATRLCAVAMGYENPRIQSGCRGTQYVAYGRAGIYATEFRPLHDDAQAMALVKRFRLHSLHQMVLDRWFVSPPDLGTMGGATDPRNGVSADLNRAIVYCVAAMQKAKGSGF